MFVVITTAEQIRAEIRWQSGTRGQLGIQSFTAVKQTIQLDIKKLKSVNIPKGCSTKNMLIN